MSKCEHRCYDEMAAGYICENPLNKESEIYERICFNENKCMVKYQLNPLLKVKDILQNHIRHYEKMRKESMIADASYIALTNLESDLEQLWK